MGGVFSGYLAELYWFSETKEFCRLKNSGVRAYFTVEKHLCAFRLC